MCPACKKRFQRHIALNAHFQNEHISPPGPNGGERTCRLCGSAFPSLGAVRHHLVVAHNIHLDSPTKCLDEAYRPPHAASGSKYSVLEASLRSGLATSGGGSSSSSSSSEASNGFESTEPSCSTMEVFSYSGGGSGRSSPQQSDFSGAAIVSRPPPSPVHIASAACSSTDRSPERSAAQLRLRQSGQEGVVVDDVKSNGHHRQLCVITADEDDDDDVHVEDLSIRRPAPISPVPAVTITSRRYSPAPRPSRASPPPPQPHESAINVGRSVKQPHSNKRPRTSSTSGRRDYSPIPSITTTAAAANQPAGGKFTCSPCSIVFPNQTLYFLHRGFHSEANPWRCNACGHLSTDLYDFNTHLYSVAHL